LLGLVESRHFSFETNRVAMPAIGGQNVSALALNPGQSEAVDADGRLPVMTSAIVSAPSETRSRILPTTCSYSAAW